MIFICLTDPYRYIHCGTKAPNTSFIICGYRIKPPYLPLLLSGDVAAMAPIRLSEEIIKLGHRNGCFSASLVFSEVNLVDIQEGTSTRVMK